MKRGREGREENTVQGKGMKAVYGRRGEGRNACIWRGERGKEERVQ